MSKDGHHIREIDGRKHFQSDLYPDLALDHIVLSFKDPAARQALWRYAVAIEANGLEEFVLSADIRAVIIDMESDAGTNTAG